MMMAPAPLPPKQSDFYNIVCNGTWLNRSQFSQAQADFRESDTKFKSEQLAQQNKDWFQQSAEANPFAVAFSANRAGANAATTAVALLPQTSPFLAEARGFYSKLSENLAQIRLNLSLALIRTVEMPKLMTQGFLALFAVAFFSGRKNLTTSTGTAKTDEQEAIMKAADDKRESPKIFNTNVVKATAGGAGTSS
jgi:hypothetical protein